MQQMESCYFKQWRSHRCFFWTQLDWYTEGCFNYKEETLHIKWCMTKQAAFIWLSRQLELNPETANCRGDLSLASSPLVLLRGGKASHRKLKSIWAAVVQNVTADRFTICLWERQQLGKPRHHHSSVESPLSIKPSSLQQRELESQLSEIEISRY